MKLTNFLKVGAIALLFSLTLASCKKEEQKFSNEMLYNNNVTAIAQVKLDLHTSADGCHFELHDADDNKILEIELAISLFGQKLDLSAKDPYSGVDNHYNYFIYNDYDYAEETWTSKYIYLCGMEDYEYSGLVCADKGSYLLVKKIDDTNYSIDLYATKDGFKLQVNYSGEVVVNQD